MKRVALLLALLAIVLWVYFNNRQDEMYYYPERDELLEYITSDYFNPEKFKDMMSKMTNDKDSILIAYTFAKQGEYDKLFYFVEDFFGARKI
jgi:hypothetical protein